MIYKVAVVGAGIIGMTNAMVLLEKGFTVTLFTKDQPLETNSDAAVATWYPPGNTKPRLTQYCIDSLIKFAELISSEPEAGVENIPVLLYFKNEEEFKKSVWAEESLKKLVRLTKPPIEQVIKIADFPFTVLVHTPLINPILYRPYMLEKFKACKKATLVIKTIDSLAQLTDDYDIVVNSTGWEAQQLAQDLSVYPIRGQTETMRTNDMQAYSLNVEDILAYVVFRPSSKDCVFGTTFQEGDSDRGIRASDKKAIIDKVSHFFPEVKKAQSFSKVGIRCGRPEVRIDAEQVKNNKGGKALIVHCYGHGGSGFSASWGSAYKVLEYCTSFSHEAEPTYQLKL